MIINEKQLSEPAVKVSNPTPYQQRKQAINLTIVQKAEVITQSGDEEVADKIPIHDDSPTNCSSPSPANHRLQAKQSEIKFEQSQPQIKARKVLLARDCPSSPVNIQLRQMSQANH